ncbi:MAG: zeta toxin family protein [Bacteroidales bacterium]|jgi:predicted ABC-type ATPase|nr:zeta toxin family protein [Bacteroidales bacterium]
MDKKEIFIIAGCNGAGKTTAAMTVLPEIIHFTEFINADEIAKGLSPINPEQSAIDAGKIMLNKIDELVKQGKSFAFETTLSGKLYADRFIEAQKKGYHTYLLFLWLPDVEMACERVKSRVLSGGHSIEQDIIRRRYYRGIENLFDVYMPISDEVVIFDNSVSPLDMIAMKSSNNFEIINSKKYKQLVSLHNETSINTKFARSNR